MCIGTLPTRPTLVDSGRICAPGCFGVFLLFLFSFFFSVSSSLSFPPFSFFPRGIWRFNRPIRLNWADVASTREFFSSSGAVLQANCSLNSSSFFSFIIIYDDDSSTTSCCLLLVLLIIIISLSSLIDGGGGGTCVVVVVVVPQRAPAELSSSTTQRLRLRDVSARLFV